MNEKNTKNVMLISIIFTIVSVLGVTFGGKISSSVVNISLLVLGLSMIVYSYAVPYQEQYHEKIFGKNLFIISGIAVLFAVVLFVALLDNMMWAIGGVAAVIIMFVLFITHFNKVVDNKSHGEN